MQSPNQQTTRKKITNPTLITMLRIFIAANFLGRPSYRSFAKGITHKVSSATMRITQVIYSGCLGSSRKVAISPVVNKSSAVNKIVVISIDVEEVL